MCVRRCKLASTHFLATPLGTKKLESVTMADSRSNNGEIHPDNIVRPTIEKLSAADRQAYEVYMKKRDEEASRWFLSHFAVDRHGNVSKEKDVNYSSEQDKVKSNVSTSPEVNSEIANLVDVAVSASLNNKFVAITGHVESMMNSRFE